MPTSVLLSIKPRFAEAILDGRKCFEFRRALFRNRDIESVLIYASSPVCRVIGEFKIEHILEMSPEALWAVTHLGSGIEKSYFFDYFVGRNTAYALKVKSAVRYKQPLRLIEHLGMERPPQSFCYLYGRERLPKGGRAVAMRAKCRAL
jgi:predicted transcriptional regulator